MAAGKKVGSTVSRGAARWRRLGPALGLATVGSWFGLHFALEAFKMSAGSMFPTLEMGDSLYANKAAYGLFTKSEPARGDIVVFEYPNPNPAEERVNYVKRVIGLPNDKLEFESGAPSINGWRVPRCELGRASVVEPGGESLDYQVVVEFLDGKAYLVAFDAARIDGHQGPYRVAPGEFWVLGDNRNNSSDSRAWAGNRGAGVPLQNSKGRGWRLWLPVERFGIALDGAPTLPSRLRELQPALARCLAQAPSRAQSTPPPASASN